MTNPQNPFRGQQVLTLIGSEQTTSSLVVMIPLGISRFGYWLNIPKAGLRFPEVLPAEYPAGLENFLLGCTEFWIDCLKDWCSAPPET